MCSRTPQTQPEARAKFTVVMLAIAYLFNFTDRQVLVILQESIKHDLNLADWQLGLLSGFAFAILYSLVGVPIARLADRGNRNKIIAISLIAWSGMTAACGLALNYWQLLLARIGVGIGEAGCTPPAHSMISDLYPPSSRATAMSCYNLGVYAGIFVGLYVGGWLNETVGWRMAFVYVALPGIAFALLFWATVPEPERRSWRSTPASTAAPPTSAVIKYLFELRSFRHLLIAGSLHVFVGYGLGNWTPSFFIRLHNVGSGELVNWFAPLNAIAGAVGALLGGVIADRLAQRDPRWNTWLPGIAILFSTPFLLFVYLADNWKLAMIVAVIPWILGATYLGPMISVTHSLVSTRMRAVASSIVLLVLNLIGLGVGPWFTGLMSDLLEPKFGVESLRWALVIVLFVNIWCALHYYLASRSLPKDLARAAT